MNIAILGSGNIGTDLLMKVQRSPVLRCALFIGRNLSSPGLAKASSLGVPISDRSLEATLLRDADGLDFLGVVGVLRDFSKNPRDLRAAYDQVQKRRHTVPTMLQLDRARAIAEKRIREMDALLQQWEADSFGCF